MSNAVSRCGDHGYHEGERCPTCGAHGETFLSGDRRRRLSKFVSGALRHFPGDAGIELDEAGWTPFDDVATSVEGKYDWAGRAELAAVVATDPKGRFERGERDGVDSLRAAYGHSVDVDLDAGTAGGDGDATRGASDDEAVPDVLYHGTAPRNLDSIREEGLRPMARQQVHLSGSVAAAREVGSRHADDSVVLAVDAAGMVADGHRVTGRSRETYTTDAVPPEYLTVRGDLRDG